MRLPYPGLRPFRREESDLFFGREGCVDQMVDRVAATRFLAVLGPSGSGKSSLVITGLLDALEIGLCAAAGSRWQIAHLRPGNRPIENLARALPRPAEEESPISDLDVALLSSYLRRGPRSIEEWCTDGNIAVGTNLLILVDQFEELFRYSDYAGREEAEAFVTLLLESAQSRDGVIYVTITMRSEYLGACALLPGLAERINAGLYLVPRMTRAEVREAIEGPAGVCGFSIEPALVNRLLNDLVNLAPWEDDPSTDDLQRLARRADQLPLMQHVLNRMWLRAVDTADDLPIQLRVADYDRIGGLTGALDAHAREVFVSLAEPDRPVVEIVFRALVSGTTIENAVRRPCRFSDLVALAKGDREAVTRVVDAFRGPECNFLMPSREVALGDDTVIDISHESLIRQWSALRDWVRDEFQSAQYYRHIETTAQLWDKGEAGLLTMPYLGVVLAWRQREHPSAAWAARYGGDWELALRFLDASGRRRALRRRVTAALVCCIVLGTGVFGALQFNAARTSENQLAMAQRNLNQLQEDIQKARSQLKDANLADELTDFHVPPQDTLEANVGTQTPRTIPGAVVVSTKDLGQLVTSSPAPLLIDALADSHESTIPAAVRIPFSGQSGDWNDEIQHRMKVRLDHLTNNNHDAPLVFFCFGAKCWESYNASLRAMHAGYTHVYWYRGGLSSWQAAGFHLQHVSEKAQELREEILRSHTITPTRRWALAVSLGEIAEQMVNESDASPAYLNQAIEDEKLAFSELKKLINVIPDNVELLSDLVTAGIQLAEAFENRGMFEMADSAYRDIGAFQQRLASHAEHEPDSIWLRNVSRVDAKIATAFYNRSKFLDAIDAFHAAEAIDKALGDREPTNSRFQQRLWTDAVYIGASLEAVSQYNEALTNFRRSLDLIRRLADAQPESAEWQHDISYSYRMIGDVLTKQDKLNDAFQAYRSAADVANSALKKYVTDSQLKDDVSVSAENIGGLAYRLVLAKDFGKALDAADFAISLAPDTIWIETNRAHALMFLGERDNARAIYLQFRGKKSRGEKSWEDEVEGDFADLRKHGFAEPLMDEIEKTFHAS